MTRPGVAWPHTPHTPRREHTTTAPHPGPARAPTPDRLSRRDTARTHTVSHAGRPPGVTPCVRRDPRPEPEPGVGHHPLLTHLPRWVTCVYAGKHRSFANRNARGTQRTGDEITTRSCHHVGTKTCHPNDTETTPTWPTL